MNTHLLRPEVQEYLYEHESTPLEKFIFKGSPFPDITIQELAQQLDGRFRIRHKVPLWYKTRGIVFPPKINLEQTSSCFTATYKSQLAIGNTLVDMTGGFGVDSFYFAKKIDQVTHIEMNGGLSAFAKANFTTLNVRNVTHVIGDSIAYIKATSNDYDTVYIDPARRNEKDGKVFKLGDCLPNVPEHLGFLLKKSKRIIIKTSPLLDITQGLLELENVSQIHIIALKNEVKELLWVLDKECAKDIRVFTINKTTRSTETDSFSKLEMENALATYSEPQQFLYEPNGALMKSGVFNCISSRYGIKKLHQHTHLYTNNTPIEFPGRGFVIDRVIPFGKQTKKLLNLKKANVATRNFKLSVAAIRKRLNLKDGGDTYLFFTTDITNSQIVIVCHKV